jgi:hypothetical protein
MKRYLLVALVLVAVRGFAQSDSTTSTSDLGAQLEEASHIDDPAKRLQAYDTIVHDYELGSQDLVQVTSSKWVGSSSTDPIDDSRTIMLTLDSDAGQDGTGSPVSLVLRYGAQHSDVYINWSSSLGPTASVTSRIGKEKATTAEWVESKDGKATFYPDDAAGLIAKLKDVDTFVAKVVPPKGDPLIAQFDVSGLADAISRYAADVDW